jgi:hypothetical protein
VRSAPGSMGVGAARVAALAGGGLLAAVLFRIGNSAYFRVPWVRRRPGTRHTTL